MVLPVASHSVDARVSATVVRRRGPLSTLDAMRHTSKLLGVAPAVVRAEFTSREFLLAFSEEVGVTSGELTMADGDAHSADMPWTFPTNRPGIPSLAQKMLPAEVRLDWHQEWGPQSASPVTGTIRVDLHGSPSATVTATTSLAQTGSDTVYAVDTRTKTSLRWPVAGTVETTIDKELVGWILQVQSRVARRRLGLPE